MLLLLLVTAHHINFLLSMQTFISEKSSTLIIRKCIFMEENKSGVKLMAYSQRKMTNGNNKRITSSLGFLCIASIMRAFIKSQCNEAFSAFILHNTSKWKRIFGLIHVKCYFWGEIAWNVLNAPHYQLEMGK